MASTQSNVQRHETFSHPDAHYGNGCEESASLSARPRAKAEAIGRWRTLQPGLGKSMLRGGMRLQVAALVSRDLWQSHSRGTSTIRRARCRSGACYGLHLPARPVAITSAAASARSPIAHAAAFAQATCMHLVRVHSGPLRHRRRRLPNFIVVRRVLRRVLKHQSLLLRAKTWPCHAHCP